MMTMTDEAATQEIGIEKTKAPRFGKKQVALLTVGVLILAGGITVTSVSVANANAEETARQCTLALKDGATATKAAKASITAADEALDAVQSVTLPGEAGTSTDYAARPAVEAVEAVAAVPGRASGAELIVDVTEGSAALATITIPTTCVERDEAETIAALVAGSKTAATVLDTSAETLLADFAVFQTDEGARIAAEIEAARVAAEKEAARVAAEEAARKAAEVEAARKAAARNGRGGGGGGESAPKSGGGGYKSSPKSGGGGGGSTPPSGGGGVGPKPPPGTCLVDNGHGGVAACP
jgi:hypothetical protein